MNTQVDKSDHTPVSSDQVPQNRDSSPFEENKEKVPPNAPEPMSKKRQSTKQADKALENEKRPKMAAPAARQEEKADVEDAEEKNEENNEEERRTLQRIKSENAKIHYEDFDDKEIDRSEGEVLQEEIEEEDNENQEKQYPPKGYYNRGNL